MRRSFLPEVTTTQGVVAHFYHQEFERCRIMDKHLMRAGEEVFRYKVYQDIGTGRAVLCDQVASEGIAVFDFFQRRRRVRSLGLGSRNSGVRDDYPTAKLERILLNSGRGGAAGEERER